MPHVVTKITDLLRLSQKVKEIGRVSSLAIFTYYHNFFSSIG